jgi:hypothetical protein
MYQTIAPNLGFLKMNFNMCVIAKMMPVETTPAMRGEGDKGEWWRG